MIHYKVLEDLYKQAKKSAPDLTDDQHFEMAMIAYREIEYKVLMGPSSPVGVMEFGKYSYPSLIDKKCEK